MSLLWFLKAVTSKLLLQKYFVTRLRVLHFFFIFVTHKPHSSSSREYSSDETTFLLINLINSATGDLTAREVYIVNLPISPFCRIYVIKYVLTKGRLSREIQGMHTYVGLMQSLFRAARALQILYAFTLTIRFDIKIILNLLFITTAVMIHLLPYSLLQCNKVSSFHLSYFFKEILSNFSLKKLSNLT